MDNKLGDIDVNKLGIIQNLIAMEKGEKCHTS